MSIQKGLDYLSHLFLAGATAGMMLAFMELIAQFADTSLISGAYPPGRIIELSAALLVLVIAITLGEIRDELRGRNADREH